MGLLACVVCLNAQTNSAQAKTLAFETWPKLERLQTRFGCGRLYETKHEPPKGEVLEIEA